MDGTNDGRDGGGPAESPTVRLTPQQSDQHISLAASFHDQNPTFGRRASLAVTTTSRVVMVVSTFDSERLSNE